MTGGSQTFSNSAQRSIHTSSVCKCFPNHPRDASTASQMLVGTISSNINKDVVFKILMNGIPPFASVPRIYWLDKAANKVT